MKTKFKLFYLVVISIVVCVCLCFLVYISNNNSKTSDNVVNSDPNYTLGNLGMTTNADVSNTHSITASTSLNNDINLSSENAEAGETITVNVANPKYGFYISEVSFVNEQNQKVEGIKYSINDNDVTFTMPDQNVDVQISYDTIATNEYNDIEYLTGRMKWSKDAGQKVCDIDAAFGMDLFLDNNNEIYNPGISIMASLFSNAAYYRAGSEADLDGSYVKWDNKPETGNPDLDVYTNLGFRDVEYVKFSSDSNLEADDITDAYFAWCPVLTDDNDVVNCYVCSVRGTNGTLKEWASNFDVGAYTSDYWAWAAPHWKNKDNHKGFDVTAELVLNYLEHYVSVHNAGDVNMAIKNCLLITGHSRGAAIANVLGAKVVDKIFNCEYFTNFFPFVYCFAPPKTTTDSSAEYVKYKCIKNLINGDDTVPTLPYKSWGFTWYGEQHKYTVSEDEDLEELLESKAKWDSGDYWAPLDPEGKFKIMEDCALSMTTTRNGIYIPCEDWEISPLGRRTCYLTEGGKDYVKSQLEKEGYLRYCDTANWGSDMTEVMPSAAYCMYFLAHVANDSNYIFIWGHPWVIECEGVYFDFLFLFAEDGLLTMKDPHYVLTYYTMVRYRNF